MTDAWGFKDENHNREPQSPSARSNHNTSVLSPSMSYRAANNVSPLTMRSMAPDPFSNSPSKRSPYIDTRREEDSFNTPSKLGRAFDEFQSGTPTRSAKSSMSPAFQRQFSRSTPKQERQFTSSSPKFDQNPPQFSVNVRSSPSVRSSSSGMNDLESRFDDMSVVTDANPPSTVNFNGQSDLYKLIKMKDWSSVLRRCKEKPNEAGLWIVEKSGDGSVRWKLLPIHQAAKMKAPKQVIEALIRANPKAAQMKDSAGVLPIHLACREGCDEAVILTLLRVFPNSAQMKDDEGRLPLHLVCRRGATVNIVNKILWKYNNGAQAKDKSGLLPLHWACYHNNSKDVIEVLIRAHPSSVNTKDKWGRTPISLAQASTNPQKDIVLEALNRDATYWTTSLANEVSSLRSQLTSNGNAEQALKERIMTLGARLEEVTAASNEASTSSRIEKGDLQGQNESMRRALDERTKMVEALQARNSSLLESVDEFRQRDQAQNLKLTELSSDMEMYKASSIQLENKVNLLMSQNNSMLLKNAELEKNMSKSSNLVKFMKEDHYQISQAAERLERALTEASGAAESSVNHTEFDFSHVESD